MSEVKKIERINVALTSKIEKKILIAIAQRLPKWIKSDHLTILGLIGASITGVSYLLTNYKISFLWLASFGIIINWLGDSLDGTLARVRNHQRPKYGFFIDHNVDIMNEIMIGLGAGLSPFFSLWSVLLVIVAYYAMTVFVFINTYLDNKFQISYGKLGPTELRIIVILFNTFIFFVPTHQIEFVYGNIKLELFDFFALTIALVIFIIYLINFFRQLKYFNKLDPLKTDTDESKN